MPMDIQVGDVLELKKAHPCGSKEWKVLRMGMDFKLKCLGCGHEVMTPRAKAEKYAKILSKTIINPEGDSFGQNAFFYDSAEGLLTAVILLLAEFLPPRVIDGQPRERRHIVSVFKLVQDLLEPSDTKGKSRFQVLMGRLPPEHKARWFAGAALNTSEQSMASVLSTVLSRLNAFLDTELEQTICFDSPIDAESFASRKSAIFLVLPEEYHYGESPVAMYDMPYQENNIHAALTFGDAFTLEAGAAQDMLNWVKSLDFFAIVDLYHSSAVDYADIVLPACTKFECEENVKQLRDSMGHVMLANGMVAPMFESKSDLQIERLLAAQWDLEDLLPETYEELARFMLDGAAELDPRMEGITYDALLANGGVMPLPETGDDYLPDGLAEGFLTPSTRIELYYEYLADQGHALPVYEDANEAYEANPKKEQFPLYFTQGKSRYRIHAYYSSNEWFQEDFGPSLNIAPEDAEARGIATGDDVRVFNDRGSFVATALVNRSLQPGVLFMAETTYTRYYKEGFLQNVTNSARLERGYSMFFGPQIPYNDVLVEVEKA